MSREIESYFQYPSEYNPSSDFGIKPYEHPKVNDGKNRPNMDYDVRVAADTLQELQGAVIQSIANWPTADHVALVSDRANVWSKDVEQTIQDLEEEKVITKVSEIEYRFEGPISHPRITKLREKVVDKVKGLFQKK